MGCRQSQTDSKETIETGTKVIGNIGNGKENEFLDVPIASSKSIEKLGMSSRQIFSLRQSWKGIKRNMEETGVEIFVR